MMLRDRLKELMDEQKITQAEISRKAGADPNGKLYFPPATISNILDGTTNEDNISVRKILKLAEVLCVSVEYLYGRSPCKNGEPEAKSGRCHAHGLDRIAEIYEDMSDEGQCKLVAYAEDLADSGKYKKDNSDGMVQKQA